MYNAKGQFVYQQHFIYQHQSLWLNRDAGEKVFRKCLQTKRAELAEGLEHGGTRSLTVQRKLYSLGTIRCTCQYLWLKRRYWREIEFSGVCVNQEDRTRREASARQGNDSQHKKNPLYSSTSTYLPASVFSITRRYWKQLDFSMHAAQHKIENLFKTFFVLISFC